MSPIEVIAEIVKALAVLFICSLGAFYLGSLARKAWREIREWFALRWARRFIDDIRRML